MPTFRQRVKQLNDEAKRLGTLGKVLRWAAIGAVTWLAGKVLDILTDQWISEQLSWLWTQIKDFADQPIGTVWLLLALLFTLGMIVSLSFVYINAWRETRPKPVAPAPEPKPPERQPLSAYEQHAKQDARVLWQAAGKEAGWLVASLLEQVSRQLRPTIRLAQLLWVPKNELEQVLRYLDGTLHEFSQTPLNDVAQVLISLFNFYMNGVGWLHDCSDNYGIDLKSDPYAAQ